MSNAYDRYCELVTQWRDEPERLKQELQRAGERQSQADGLAEAAVTAAEEAHATALEFIASQLAAARLALEPLGQETLVPPRTAPSGIVKAATRDDVTAAQGALAGALNQLRATVAAQLTHRAADDQRQALEPAEALRRAHEPAAPAITRKRVLQSVVVGLVLLMIITVVLFTI